MTFEITFQGLTIGPLEIRWYSVMILSGLLAGIVLAQREANRLRENPEHVLNIAVLGSIAGLIGARAYHVLDRNEWPYYQDNPGQIIAIWNGGIGIFGAIAGSALALALYVWWANRNARLGKPSATPMNVLRWFDIGAPAFLLGQGIGRWGNFFNQELFGPPTDLPWGIPIDIANRPAQYLSETHFHPLFLYESLLSLLGVVVLVYLARRLADRIRVGDVLLGYLMWYPAERFALEFLRTGNWKVGDVPMAQIVSTLLAVAALLVLVWWRRPRSADVSAALDEHVSARESRSAARRRRRRLEAEATVDGPAVADGAPPPQP